MGNFENTKMMNLYLLIMFIIALVFIGIVKYEDWLIDSDTEIIMSSVSYRDVDYKNRVTLYLEFEVNNIKYETQKVVTVYEGNTGIKIIEGDSLIIEYYKENPSYNRAKIPGYDTPLGVE